MKNTDSLKSSVAILRALEGHVRVLQVRALIEAEGACEGAEKLCQRLFFN
jgi:hypothetical protein